MSALQIAAGSFTGPSTWPLVGIAPEGTGRRGERSSTWPRFSASASRAVSDGSPNVDWISFSVEVCSNGPWWTTRHDDGRHPG